jgi:hypothetical protein
VRDDHRPVARLDSRHLVEQAQVIVEWRLAAVEVQQVIE